MTVSSHGHHSSQRLTHSLMFQPAANGNLPFLVNGMRKRETPTKPVQFRTLYDPLPLLGVPSHPYSMSLSQSVSQAVRSVSQSTFKAKDLIDVLSRLQTPLAQLDFIPHTFRLTLGNLTLALAPLDQ